MIYRITSGSYDSHHTVDVMDGPDGFDFKAAELAWLASEPPSHASKDDPGHIHSGIGYSVGRREEAFIEYLKKNCGFHDTAHQVVYLVYDDWASLNWIAEPAEGEKYARPAEEHREIQKIEIAWMAKLEADPNSILNR